MKMFDAHWAHNEGKQQFKNSKKKKHGWPKSNLPDKID